MRGAASLVACAWPQPVRHRLLPATHASPKKARLPQRSTAIHPRKALTSCVVMVPRCRVASSWNAVSRTTRLPPPSPSPSPSAAASRSTPTTSASSTNVRTAAAVCAPPTAAPPPPPAPPPSAAGPPRPAACLTSSTTSGKAAVLSSLLREKMRTCKRHASAMQATPRASPRAPTGTPARQRARVGRRQGVRKEEATHLPVRQEVDLRPPAVVLVLCGQAQQHAAAAVDHPSLQRSSDSLLPPLRPLVCMTQLSFRRRGRP